MVRATGECSSPQRTMPAPNNKTSWSVLDPAQYMGRDSDELAALVHNLDIGKRLPFQRIDLRNVIGERDRIADEYCSEKSNLVVTERNRRFAERRAFALFDHHGRTRRHVTDEQRAMCNASAIFR